MIFRDDWDRKAHDVMCIAKYGTPGGSVNTKDMHRAGDLGALHFPQLLQFRAQALLTLGGDIGRAAPPRWFVSAHGALL